VLIVGGGLAGLALALQLGEDDVRVILIDKKILGNDAQNNCNNNNKRGGGEEGGGGVLLTPANVLWARKVGIFKELREAEECEVIRNFEGLSNPTLITNGKVAADSESDYLGAVRHTESSDPSSETGYLARELFTKKNYSEDKCSYLNISQSRIEEAILKKLKEKKSVEVRRNVRCAFACFCFFHHITSHQIA
jgi:2-polyprenyl-6-methoxyphenol hydroxylase-like FAD-dependent oxidoreductase